MDIKVGLSIYNKPWLIEASAGLQLLDFFERIKTGEVKWDYNEVKGESDKRPSTYSTYKKFFAKAEVIMAPDSSWDMEDFKGFDGATVAIIPVSGPMMKNDFCGSFGTRTLSRLTQMASATPSVQTILYVVDCPGGTVDGTKAFADSIKASQKRTIALVDGMMCSAGYWIGSSCDEVYSSAETDLIGCIGTMCSFYDNTEALKMKGIVLREYKATDSKDKNTDIDEAIKGNGKKLIQDILDPQNDIFLGTVRQNRGNKLDEKALSGTTYTAVAAQELGLIDGIKSIEEVLVTAQRPQTITHKNTTVMEIKNLADLRAQYPGLVAEAVAEGHKTGIASEQTRVQSWMVYNDVDPKAVAEGITKGETLGPVATAEFGKKMFAKQGLTNLNADAAEPVNPDPNASQVKPETAAIKAEKDFWATVDANTGIAKK